ncbi:MAG: CheR family methyltransferase [Hyphomicrobiaceae bacterium]
MRNTDRPDAADDIAVIGVGASAGGLEAFQELIAELSPGQSCAWVLVQHLDPDHHSLLPELLARRARVPVRLITDDLLLEPGVVHLIPPGVALTLEGKRLRLSSFESPRGLRRPIDTFFESLAAECGAQCAVIILSGTGSDGSVGIRAVKAAGGLVFVQEPKVAKYDGMPKSALATGAVDLVLPAGDMVAVLDEYFDRRAGVEPLIENDTEFIHRVTKHIRYRTGHDFADYKRATLMRRLARRMSVLGITSPASYLQRLITDHTEATQLVRDILINVTAFFRDPSTFEALQRQAISKLVAGKGRGDDVRIWVPGCSTGQEAYSIAMLVEEELARVDARPNVAIFATDIDVEAIKAARDGAYPNAIAAEVPQHLLERHFTSTPSGYRISSAMRDMVRVSQHNVIADPPFSKLDLISCRNLLLYFDNKLQTRVLPIFHYALSARGFLLLGPSENLGGIADSFEVVSQTDRLFKRKAGPPRAIGIPLFSPLQDLQSRLAQAEPESSRPPEPADLYERAILARHTAPFVVVNSSRQIVFASGKTGRFLELPRGHTRLGILEMSREALRSPLVGLLASLGDVGTVRVRPLDLEIDNAHVRVLLTAERLPDDNVLVVFQEHFDPRSEATNVSGDSDAEGHYADAYVHELEQKLDAANQTIRTTIEELETSNEELKSSNEEMMSMNEELQSANEELSTINEELQIKVSELNILNDDQRNLIESTRIATIFLDSELRIRSFTPAARGYFRLVDHDRGRRFEDLASELDGEPLIDLCRRTIETGQLSETHRQQRDGTADLLVRIQPYTSMAGVGSGVVITLMEITELKRYQRRLEELEVRARLNLSEIEELYRVTPQAKALLDRNLRFLRVNQRFADISGSPIENHLGRYALELVPQLGFELVEGVPKVFDSGKPIVSGEVTILLRGVQQWWEIDWYPVRRGEDVYAVGINIRDVTRHKVMQTELRRLMRELQHRVKNMLANVTALINRARRDDGDPEIILLTLVRRIHALAKTHNLLTAQNWRASRLIDVLRPELTEIYGSERVSLRGPELRVNARATLALGMAVHELATNAAKYGALSTDDGRLSVSWSRIDEGEGEQIVLKWVEMDGPVIEKPSHLGFGSQLVRTTVERSLGGRVDVGFDASGLNVTLSVPFDRATEEQDDAADELEELQSTLR